MPLIVSGSRRIQRDNIVGNHWQWYRGWKYILSFGNVYRDYDSVLGVFQTVLLTVPHVTLQERVPGVMGATL